MYICIEVELTYFIRTSLELRNTRCMEELRSRGAICANN